VEQALVDNYLHLRQNNPTGVFMDKTLSHESCCEVDHTAHESFEQKTGRWDKIGIFLSSLCAVHCLLTPLVILALPFLGESFEHEASHVFHIVMALVVVPVAYYAFFSGYRHHHKKGVLFSGLFGASLIGLAAFLPHEWVEFYELDVMTILGSLILVTAHVINRKACQCHTPGHKH
jgi:hypothetical protein